MKKGKILSAIGCGGVLFTFLITQTSFSSANETTFVKGKVCMFTES